MPPIWLIENKVHSNFFQTMSLTWKTRQRGVILVPWLQWTKSNLNLFSLHSNHSVESCWSFKTHLWANTSFFKEAKPYFSPISIISKFVTHHYSQAALSESLKVSLSESCTCLWTPGSKDYHISLYKHLSHWYRAWYRVVTG